MFFTVSVTVMPWRYFSLLYPNSRGIFRRTGAPCRIGSRVHSCRKRAESADARHPPCRCSPTNSAGDRHCRTEGNHVSCPWEHAHGVQNMGNRHSDPFGNEGPALLANMIGDLAAGGETFQFFERERSWTGDQAVHRQPPLRETRPTGAGRFHPLEALQRLGQTLRFRCG
jgi:hypothetical protein